ncbi:MAG: metallopeptidase family protein [Planctomycetaceae bacterium]|jgi:predicted Zn-dependent protease with MMP-like domain|nr:metallopeptidase family protein [Planctomycetaceae bacterium]
MTPSKRAYFDKQVKWVLERLPKKVKNLLEEIPLHVEDRPSRHLVRDIKMKPNTDLCGCFVGIPLGEKYNWQAQTPNTIILFRRGIYALAANEHGTCNRSELRRQIRITILHELGHFHGLNENQLEQLGYG